MIYKKWDIILVPFPFTNLTKSKKRPALIVSPNRYNKGEDIVIAFITSKLDVAKKLGDYKILQWKEAELPLPSMVRMKFATIANSIVIKKLGMLVKEDEKRFQVKLTSFFNS